MFNRDPEEFAGNDVAFRFKPIQRTPAASVELLQAFLAHQRSASVSAGQVLLQWQAVLRQTPLRRG